MDTENMTSTVCVDRISVKDIDSSLLSHLSKLSSINLTGSDCFLSFCSIHGSNALVRMGMNGDEAQESHLETTSIHDKHHW